MAGPDRPFSRAAPAIPSLVPRSTSAANCHHKSVPNAPQRTGKYSAETWCSECASRDSVRARTCTSGNEVVGRGGRTLTMYSVILPCSNSVQVLPSASVQSSSAPLFFRMSMASVLPASCAQNRGPRPSAERSLARSGSSSRIVWSSVFSFEEMTRQSLRTQEHAIQNQTDIRPATRRCTARETQRGIL